MERISKIAAFCALVFTLTQGLYGDSPVLVNITITSTNETFTDVIPPNAWECATNQESPETLRNPISVSLDMFSNENEYRLFKGLWEGSSTPTEKGDISAALFQSYIAAATHVGLQNTYLACFAETMVRKGLFGKHYEEILDLSLNLTKDTVNDVVWSMFLIFLNTNMGLRVIFHNEDPEQAIFLVANTGLMVGSPTDASLYMPKPVFKIEKAFLKEEMLGLTREVKRINETMLGWLLYHINCLSLGVTCDVLILFGPIGSLEDTVQAISKKRENGVYVAVESLDLTINMLTTLRTPGAMVFSNCPDLSVIKVLIKEDLLTGPMLIVDSLSLSSCPKLKELSLSCPNAYLTPLATSKLLESIPRIEKLLVFCEELDESCAEAFERCAQITELVLEGDSQPTAFVKRLLQKLPSLVELDIKSKELDVSIEGSFENCQYLKKLTIDGEMQTSQVIEKMMKGLPNLEELDLKCQVLSIDAALSFSSSPRLHKLCLYGQVQKTPTVLVLLSNIPSIRWLQLTVEQLDLPLAHDLRNLPRLEIIKVEGRFISGFVKELLQDPILQDLKLVRVCMTSQSEELTREDREAEANARASHTSLCTWIYVHDRSKPNVLEKEEASLLNTETETSSIMQSRRSSSDWSNHSSISLSSF
ncbi:hypothetical protein NECID01_0906 [Nematocida sp. AWRm77]|nr:hypothetical protein NECID01_0906 [Nematocida sp. AWRm77]